MHKSLGIVFLLFISSLVTATGFPQSNCVIEPGKGCGEIKIGASRNQIETTFGKSNSGNYFSKGFSVKYDSANVVEEITFVLGRNPNIYQSYSPFPANLAGNVTTQITVEQLVAKYGAPKEKRDFQALETNLTKLEYAGIRVFFAESKLFYVEIFKSSEAFALREKPDLQINSVNTAIDDDDGDGVKNADDVCPREKGSKANKGCPSDNRNGGDQKTLDSSKHNSTPKSANTNPSAAEEYFKQGKAYGDKFETRKALESFTKALEINPKYLDAFRERGIAYFMIREFNSALPDFDQALKIEPNNVKALHFRGLTLTEIAVKTKDDDNDRKTANGFAQRALADFSKAIEIEPNGFAYYSGRGKLLLNFSFVKESIADFEKSISIKPNEVAYAHLGLAKFYLDDKTAMNELNQAIKIAPTFAEAYFIRASIHRDEGRFKEAILDFDEAIKHNKYNEKYYNTRGMLYFRLQDGYMAAADFTEAINQKKDFAMAYFNRAFTYKKYPYSVSADAKDNAIDKIRLQRKKMLEDLESAIKYKPNFDAAYVERGLINSTDMRNKSVNPDAETINRLNLALADFEQAIKFNPQNADAYNGRASCHQSLGKKDLALADYTKAIELDPKLATAYMGRMMIYCEMGKKELSIADEKKVKELGLAAINICSLGGK